MLSIEHFSARLEELQALIIRLVEAESPSTDKQAVDRLGLMLADDLRRVGAAVTVYPQTTTGNHVVGHWGPSMHTSDGSTGILILCHMDTVHDIGMLARNPCRVTDGRLYGPGTQDMKSSLAMAIFAAEQLRAHDLWPDRPITFLFSSDEEIGSQTSRSLIEGLAAQAGLVLCLEPCLPDGSLKTWRKGVGDFEFVARGRSTHAGADHERGRNAIEELAHHVLAIQRLTDYEAGTTVNVGVINGGTRSNVVPDEARARVDMRVMTPAEAERIDAWLRSRQPVLEGTSLQVTGGLNRPPMVRDAVMAHTFQRAQHVAARLGMTLGEGGTGGGSDANFVAPLGVPLLDGLGPLGNGAHSEREHIMLGELPRRTALLAALISEWHAGADAQVVGNPR
jgi:glutamate carboxypeptidase